MTMPAHPLDHVPPLAGLATCQHAARIGFSVDSNVTRLIRYHWVERRVMSALIAHITAEPVWEVKCVFALHQWQAAEHVNALRMRITEMRHPVPPLDVAPGAALDSALEELLHSRGTLEFVSAVYGTFYPALRDAYREHLQRANPLVDYPTCRVLKSVLADIEEAIEWGRQAIDAVRSAGHDIDGALQWQAHLQALLDAAGGISGDAEAIAASEIDLRSKTQFVADHHPRRDERFTGTYNFEFPPHLVYNAEGVPADERNLALVCKRALEMDVPEMMASFMMERADQSWEFHHDYSRQLWDEARHAMMGTVALEARGIDWKREVPLNISFALRLNLHATALERQVMLYAIEQSLMPGETGKRFEYETAVAAGDALSAHFQDYDWADEVLHTQIGRRMLRRDGISREEAIASSAAIHDRTWAALEQYRALGPQRNWWPEFVQRALGHRGSDIEMGGAVPQVVSE